MYTIKQAAARSGVTVPTARAWERRYGVVHPERTPSGYRLYDDDAIARLTAMRFLVEGQGVRPSQAAEQVLAAGANVADLVERARRSGASDGTLPAGGTSRTGHLAEAFVAAVAAPRCFDDGTPPRRGLRRRAVRDGRRARRLPCAPRAVGDGWSEGSIDVAMEHAASETVRRRLARFYDAVASQGRSRRDRRVAARRLSRDRRARVRHRRPARAAWTSSIWARTYRSPAGSSPRRRRGRPSPFSVSPMRRTFRRPARWSRP